MFATDLLSQPFLNRHLYFTTYFTPAFLHRDAPFYGLDIRLNTTPYYIVAAFHKKDNEQVLSPQLVSFVNYIWSNMMLLYRPCMYKQIVLFSLLSIVIPQPLIR